MRTVRKALPKQWWRRHINGQLSEVSERQLKKAHGSEFSDFSENLVKISENLVKIN